MAKYFMQEMPDMSHDGETLLYPRMEITGICETEELVEISIKGSTFGRGEVIGVLDLIAGRMASIMSEGRSVRIDGIGLFTPSLSLKKGKERESIDGKSSRRNASSIEVGGIKFRPDKNLVKETNLQCDLERGMGVQKCKRSKYSQEERLQLVKDYLCKNPFLTVRDYALMVGLSRTSAARELRQWIQMSDSGITFKGSGSHKVYIRKDPS